MIAHASHGHALFHEDNSQVYYHLEEATRRTSYAASIKPFQQCKDRQGAWFTLTNQNAVCDKWEAEIKKQDDLLHMHCGKGNQTFCSKVLLPSIRMLISQCYNAQNTWNISCLMSTPGSVTYLRACRILGLTAFNSLLQCVNRLVWEVCSVN